MALLGNWDQYTRPAPKSPGRPRIYCHPGILMLALAGWRKVDIAKVAGCNPTTVNAIQKAAAK